MYQRRQSFISRFFVDFSGLRLPSVMNGKIYLAGHRPNNSDTRIRQWRTVQIAVPWDKSIPLISNECPPWHERPK